MTFVPKEDSENRFSMKGVLSEAIQEALLWAVADSCIDPMHADYEGRREELILNVDSMTDGERAGLSFGVLAQNLACRLLGSGGWTINGVYTGNASTQQVVDAAFHRADKNPLGEITNFLKSGGLTDGEVE